MCANCGKGEESAGDLKFCTACKMVKYCNRDCQIAHRPQHKKACKKRAAELHDEALFKEPPPREDCPICFLPLPLNANQSSFKSCCGMRICYGCTVSMTKEEMRRSNKKKEEFDIYAIIEEHMCAFCRTTSTSSMNEEITRIKKLMEKGNAWAFFELAGYYDSGSNGMPQNRVKTNELWLKAGELGCVDAYYMLGNSYYYGRGVEIDKKKATFFYELGAMGGDTEARHNLGALEGKAGNHQRAKKHFIIAASAGHPESLDAVKTGFRNGLVTKDEYESTLRAYQKQVDEMKSEARDDPAANV